MSTISINHVGILRNPLQCKIKRASINKPWSLRLPRSSSASRLMKPCRVSSKTDTKPAKVTRRSGNYDPSLWDFDYLQSLNNHQHYKSELERGDVPKAIQCYMKDNNAPEEEAREHVRFMIREAWKELNTAMAEPDGCPFTEQVVEAAANLGRAAQFVYREGDGHGHFQIHQHMGNLFFHPYV